MSSILQGVALTDVGDLINHTLPHFHKQGSFETVYDRRRYVALEMFFEMNTMPVQSGNSIECRYVFDENGTARFAQLGTPRGQRNLRSYGTKGSWPWRFADYEAYWEEHLLSMRRPPAEILNYLKSEYFAAKLSAANKLESRGFITPDSSSDAVNMHGLAWILRGPASGVIDYEGGFIGTTAYYGDGTSTAIDDPGGNQSRTTQPKLRNWAFTHTGANLQTLESIKRALINMNYRPPRGPAQHAGSAGKGGGPMKILWPTKYQDWYSSAVNMRADGRNGDVFPFGMIDDLPLGGVPTCGTPELDTDANEPIFGVNTNHVKTAVHADYMDKQKKARELEDPTGFWFVHWDYQMNMFSDNPRLAGFCGMLAR